MGGLEPLEFAKFWRGTLSAEGEKKGLFLEALLGGGGVGGWGMEDTAEV